MTQQHGCQKHYVEQEMAGTKEYILYDSIYMKFKIGKVNRCGRTQNSSYLWGKDEIDWNEARRSFPGNRNVLYLGFGWWLLVCIQLSKPIKLSQICSFQYM